MGPSLTSDGTVPINVTAGQRITVDVGAGFPSPLPAGPATGSLTITASGWEPITVPLTMAPIELQVSLLVQALAVQRGGTVQIPLTATLAQAAPSVTLQFALSPDFLDTGLTLLPPDTTSVAHGAQQAITLVLQAAEDAPLGLEQVFLQYTLDGERTASLPPVQLTITDESAVVMLAHVAPLEMRQGDNDIIGVNVVLGSANHSSMFTLVPEQVPAGVTLSSLTFIATGPVTTVSLKLQIASDAAPGTFMPIRIRWTGFGGTQTGLLTTLLTVDLAHETVVFDSGMLGPSTVSGQAQLALSSDGFWSFRGSVHESGAVGHNYFFAFALNVTDSAGKTLAFVQQGSVSGTFDVGSRDDTWQQDGYDPFIVASWDTIRTSGYNARLHVSTDPLQAVEAVLAGLFTAAAAAGFAVFAANATCNWQAKGPGLGVDLVCHKDF